MTTIALNLMVQVAKTAAEVGGMQEKIFVQEILDHYDTRRLLPVWCRVVVYKMMTKTGCPRAIIANELGLDRSTLSHYEHEYTPPPELPDMDRMVEALVTLKNGHAPEIQNVT